MFTGLIETLGRVERVERSDNGRSLRIAAPFVADVRTGDSIAVNGVCLTVVATGAGAFDTEISPETLRVTTLGDLTAGRPVNLERSLRADARLGGHFVLGHVDGVGKVLEFTPDGDCFVLEIESPPSVTPYLISKGSICVDGISLTIAALHGARFKAQIVPFTSSHTTLSSISAGAAVNLEADVLGKYVASLLRQSGAFVHGAEGPRIL